MKIFLGGCSAVQYWVRRSLLGPCSALVQEPLRRRMGAWGLQPARIRVLSERPPSDEVLRGHVDRVLFGLPLPLDILVSKRGVRNESSLKVCRVWSKPVPPGSFVRVADDLYVAMPEFAFRQLSRGLSDVSTVKLAYELCASYVRSDEDARGFRVCPPLTSVALLRAHFGAGRNGRALEHLTLPLKYVRDGAASPAETLLAAALLLSRARGGFGLTGGELNGWLEVPPEGFLGRDALRYACDLLWRAEHVAVEYDSDMYHTGPDRIARDSERKNRLLDAGYSVVTVTKRQLFDPWAFTTVAGQIARALGKRADNRKRDYDWHARYMSMRRDLFDAPALWVTGV